MAILNGDFDAYITKWAQSSKTWGHPYFLRLMHEFNGTWTAWNETVNGNSLGQFMKAWRHVHDIFTALGATNANFVWSPNVQVGNTPSLSALYPGDSYVDWVAMDGYNQGTCPGNAWQTFDQVFRGTYDQILATETRPRRSNL